MVRAIVSLVSSRNLRLGFKDLGFNPNRIKRLWTVYDVERFNSFCYRTNKSLSDVSLWRSDGIVQEDLFNDWFLVNGNLVYCSRLVEEGSTNTVILELD